MEFLYNPDSMSEEEIKATFVAREWLIDELSGRIKRQPDGAGVQHILIIAPRGMGKTTVLLMVKFAINDSRLSKQWHAVKFPEESYGVYDLADFWLEVLNLIAADTKDEELRQQAENLKTEFPNNDDLQEAALALVKDWRRKHKKRLVLLVDNFDMVLEQINDERDEARLREVLMNDGAMMMLGCAVSFFDEARSYEKPLYNFFKIYDLASLKFEQMQELLRRRARLDRVENFEATLKANKTRLRVLEYFTSGNPRLVLMLYRVVTQSDITEVQRSLEKLLDEVTPYFKSKVESLPPQLRKILDHIARISSQTNEGLTPTEIAQAVRLTANQVSAQLKRLSEIGYVRAANLRSRSSYYTLSEPLYAIWHQMRFGRNARERMQWLVSFLKAYYDADEMQTENARLEQRFQELFSTGQLLKARDVLEHRRYLAEAMEDIKLRLHTVDDVVCGYLDLKETSILKKEILSDVPLESFSGNTLKRLLETKLITQPQFKQAKARQFSRGTPNEIEFVKTLKLFVKAIEKGKANEALEQAELVVKLQPDFYPAWSLRGYILGKLGQYKEAVASFDRAIQINPNSAESWANRGAILARMDEDDKAVASFDRAIQVEPNYGRAWYGRGRVLYKRREFKDAVGCFDRALEMKPDLIGALLFRGLALTMLHKPEEAIESFDYVLRNTANDDAYIEAHTGAHLMKFAFLMVENKFELARQQWLDALHSAKSSPNDIWQTSLSDVLLTFATSGPLEFVRQLIAASDLEEHLFPLARAIDYLLTGDESLIEKLSPEVRGIVEEIITKLRKSADAGKQSTDKSLASRKTSAKEKSGASKAKRGSRNRTRKQLR